MGSSLETIRTEVSQLRQVLNQVLQPLGTLLRFTPNPSLHFLLSICKEHLFLHQLSPGSLYHLCLLHISSSSQWSTNISPGCILKRQIPGPHPRPAQSKPVGQDPAICILKCTSRQFHGKVCKINFAGGSAGSVTMQKVPSNREKAFCREVRFQAMLTTPHCVSLGSLLCSLRSASSKKN
jgi:hypothetical protein